MSAKEVGEILEMVAKGVALAGGIWAFFTYRRDVKRRRADLMKSLYEKFYEAVQLKKVRLLLDYRPQEYDEMRSLIQSGKAGQRAEDLVDYLNFFEFIASLWKLRQISYKDVCMLFHYYLKNLRSHDWIMKFVKENGFEALQELLEEISRKESS